MKKKNEKKYNKNNRIKLFIAVIIIGFIGILSYSLIKEYQEKAREEQYCKIADEKISTSEFQFYKNMITEDFLNKNDDNLNRLGKDGLTLNKSYKSQKYNTALTWDDYFNQLTATFIQQTRAFQKEIKNIDVKNKVYDWKEKIKQDVSAEGISIDDYFQYYYGKDITEKTVTKWMSTYFAMNEYLEKLKVNEEEKLTTEFIDDYIEKNQEDFKKITYRAYDFYYTNDNKQSQEQSSEDKANEFLNQITDESSFNDLCIQYEPENSQISYKNNKDNSLYTSNIKTLNKSIREWLTDPLRVTGDKTVIKDKESKSYKVLYFISSEIDTLNGLNFYDIFIDKQYGGATETAIELQEDWKHSDKTEEKFLSLSESYNKKYNITSDELNKELKNWLYSDREVGDAELIETNEGYHFLYYLEPSTLNSSQIKARNQIVNNTLEKMIQKQIKDYPIKDKFNNLKYLRVTEEK